MHENNYKQKRLAQKWSLTDLEKLKKFYHQKMSLKQMSEQLNRSVTSINKVLDRQGIRQKKLNYDSECIPKRFLNGYQEKNNLNKTALQKFDQFWEYAQPTLESWVEMKDVVDFLAERGYMIERPQGKMYQDLFIVNGKSFSEAQVLIEANRFRDFDDRGPYCVEGVTTC